MNLQLLLQALVNGILLGGVYALIALGLSIVFGVMRVLNVAHGDLVTLGAVVAFISITRFGMHPFVAGAVALFTLLILGALLQRAVVEMALRRTSSAMPLIGLFAAAVVLRSLILMTLGREHFSVSYWTGGFALGSVVVSIPRLYAFSLALITSAAFFLFLRRSRWGIALRATAESATLASAFGLDVRRVRTIAFAAGAAAAGVAGALLVTTFAVDPGAGQSFLLISFAAAVLGGLGNTVGTFIAGVAIGLVETVSGLLLDVEASQGVVYAVLVVGLLFKVAARTLDAEGSAGGPA